MTTSADITKLKTPCYLYDMALLDQTLNTINAEVAKYPNFRVHFAVKANANPRILKAISASGLGADCVSGNEVMRAIECGFSADKVVFAGVGKSDEEIEKALNADIFCFNCESIPELYVLNEIALRLGKKTRIALRINPNVDAHTHHYITTGMEENKFGIYLPDLDNVLAELPALKQLELIGIHFHIGSQITDMEPFEKLCQKANEIQEKLMEKGVNLRLVNFGGGLGIDYNQPDENPIPQFASFFNVIATHFKAQPGQEVHFELGRSVVAQCGRLIAKVLYVKNSGSKQFVILDAGMNDLIRPALYQAYHKIENLTSTLPIEKYDVVGPICESSDCFGKDVMLNATKRGDYIALCSAGAYGEIMAMQYNCRNLPGAYYLEEQ